MNFIETWLNCIHDWVWGPPLLILLIGTGVLLTIRTKGLQFKYLKYALTLSFSSHKQDDKGQEGDISHFQALMTALAATIGVGTIAGVGTAISVGGLGSIFWMVLVGMLGMATKYSEAILAVTYRVKEPDGTMSGGPMYYLDRGLGWKKMAKAFAVFATIATIGTGNMVQAHSVEDALSQFVNLNPWIVGSIIAVCVGLVVIGGVQSIGKASSVIVPFMALIYLLCALYVLGINIPAIPGAIMMIVESGFNGQAAFGGFLGAGIMLAIQEGVSKGIFSNESGLGSAPIAAAAARTDYPGRQAMIAMMGTFFTVVITFITGLVIAVSGVMGEMGPRGDLLSGALLTIEAFARFIPYGRGILTFALILFALSTIIGWAYYGERCCSYLFGNRGVKIYRFVFPLCVIPGAVFSLQAVWHLAGIMNAMMAIPNLLALIWLSGVVVRETKLFKNVIRQESSKDLELQPIPVEQ